MKDLNELIKESTPIAVSEGLKFVEKSNGLFKNEDIPAFIAGFLAHVVIQNKSVSDVTNKGE